MRRRQFRFLLFSSHSLWNGGSTQDKYLGAAELFSPLPLRSFSRGISGGLRSVYQIRCRTNCALHNALFSRTTRSEIQCRRSARGDEDETERKNRIIIHSKRCAAAAGRSAKRADSALRMSEALRGKGRGLNMLLNER